MIMKKPVVLILCFFILLSQVPAFIRAMKHKQTARSWFAGFVIALLAGCCMVYFLRPEM